VSLSDDPMGWSFDVIGTAVRLRKRPTQLQGGILDTCTR
jgi:hypothetical protein